MSTFMTRLFVALLWLAGFATVRAGDAEFQTRPVRGTIRFSNTNTEILERLGPPGNEGVTSIGVFADSRAPNAGLRSTAVPPATNRLSNTYSLIVQAGADDASAFAYGVGAVLYLDSDRAGYFTRIVETTPLVRGPEPVTADIEECVALLDLRFVDGNGNPVSVADSDGHVFDPTGQRGSLFSAPGGNTGRRIVVPSGVEVSVLLNIRRGLDPYADRLNHVFEISTNLPCDSVAVVNVTLPGSSGLGRITGRVDMEGEFELTTEASTVTPVIGRTALVAEGPGNNRRYNFVAGDNVLVPASGSFELENLPPSLPTEPWRVHAEMHFRTNRAFSYFVSPVLGDGANTGVSVTAGETTDLDDTFVMRPAFVRGSVFLSGPPDTATEKSALRGLRRGDDIGTTDYGIPLSVGTYGIHTTYIAAQGVDRAPEGAQYTAAGGFSGTSFRGEFLASSGAFEGDYELVVAGLDGAGSVWRRNQFVLSLVSNPTNGVPLVSESLSILENSNPEIELQPGAAAVSDVRFGFGEVCVRFRSAGTRFYNANVSSSGQGGLVGTDFEGRARNYRVVLDGAYGTRLSRESAANADLVTAYLPEGEYDLLPRVTTVAEDGSERITQLDPVHVRVVARSRICVEACLRVTISGPSCTTGGTAPFIASIQNCGEPVTRVSYQIDDGEIHTLCTECGSATNIVFNAAIPAGAHRLAVTAEDSLGAVTTVELDLGLDTTPPEITCPASLSLPANEPCGARVDFTISATDACSGAVSVASEPPSGSLFPIGETTVVCTATDAAGNRSQCSFTVTVRNQIPDLAALIVHEPFDYPDAPAPLSGLAGGRGFSGPWQPGGFNTDPANNGAYSVITSTPVAGSLNHSGGSVRAGALTGIGGLVRPFTTPLGADGTTAYFAIVLKPGSTPGQGAFNGFYGLTLSGSNGDDVFIGKPGGGSTDHYVMERRGGAGQIATGVEVAPLTPALLVLRAEFREGNDRFVLYANPAPGGVEPTTGAEITDLDLGTVSQLGLYSSGEFEADEIRVGTSYADVVPERITFPVPMIETVSPATVAVAGGTPVTVHGVNFTDSDEILIDGTPLVSQLLVSPTEITGLAPALPAGSHSVQIRRCGTVIAVQPAAISGGLIQRIYFLSPQAVFAEGGIRVTVIGTNFTPDTRIRFAFPAGEPSEGLLLDANVSDDGTTITGLAPALPPGVALGIYDVIADDPQGRDVLPAGIRYIPKTSASDPQIVALEQLRTDSETAVDIVMRNGFPHTISARVTVPGANPQERAMSFVRRYRDIFRLASPDAELTPEPAAPGDMVAVKLGQTFRGLPVLGSELSVLVSGERVIDAVGGLLPTEALLAPGFSATPVLTTLEAIAIARAEPGLEFAPVAAGPSLAIFDRCLVQEAVSDPRLVWRILLEGAGEELLIDARTGGIVFRDRLDHENANQHEGLNLNLRDARNTFSPSTPTNQPVCYGSSQVLAAGNRDGTFSAYQADVHVTAAWAVARQAYAFFNVNFGWRSYDNRSSEFKVVAHSTVDNAQWSGACKTMSFRDGWVDYEVMVHEMTHGVINSTSNLRYFLESGALNESYADVMALFADRQAGDLNWTLGENRVGAAGAVRDIPNEGIRFWGQFNPGNGTETSTNDYGNVHSNSGIPNFAAYILATRSRILEGRSAAPLTAAKILRLKFDALRSLTRDSTFLDARTREVSLAQEWAARGLYGFSVDDVTQVARSWDDVGIGFPSDLDRDGIPDFYDNCRNRANPRQEDTDRDGVGDVCDNCKNTPNPRQDDLDLDGIGDVCDDDLDGDGCLNVVDQHPNSSQIVVGRYTGPTCISGGGDITRFEGEDSDFDGRRDCEDNDDDNDGIPDDQDGCPAGLFGGLGGCTQLRDCPEIRNDWFRVCRGGGCNEFQLRMTDRINPDPTRTFTFDRVRIVNESLYVAPNVGSRLSDAAIIFVGGRSVRNSGLQPRAAQLLRLELWTHATPTEPARLVSVIADYNPAGVDIGQLDLGTFLVFTPPSGTNAPTLGATWHIGGNPLEAANDLDHDGIPDGWEIQNGLDPRNPADAALDTDGDGLTAAQEFQAGSSPREGSSRLAIGGIDRENAGMKIRIHAPAGRQVQVERTFSLTSPAWETVNEVIRMTGDSAFVLDANVSTQDRVFYRLREIVR